MTTQNPRSTRDPGPRRPDALSARFHADLFRRHPELQHTLPASAADYLDASSPLILDIVLGLRDVEALDKALARFVEFFAKLGLTQRQLEGAGEALFAVLAGFCGPQWTKVLSQTTEMLYRLNIEERALDPTRGRPALARDQGAGRGREPRPKEGRPAEATRGAGSGLRRAESEDGRRGQGRHRAADEGRVEAADEPATKAPVALATLPMVVDRAVEGSLEVRPLVKLLHGLHVMRWTGRLTLALGALTLSIDLLDGQVGSAQPGFAAQRASCLSAFAWQEGVYRLDSSAAPDARAFTSFGDLAPLILEGLAAHTSVNNLGRLLSPWMRHYPVPVTQIERHLEAMCHPQPLSRLCTLCDGQRRLEELLLAAEAELHAALAAAWYAVQTSLFVMWPVPTDAALQLQYINLRSPDGDKALRPEADRRNKSRPPPPPAIASPLRPLAAPRPPETPPRASRAVERPAETPPPAVLVAERSAPARAGVAVERPAEIPARADVGRHGHAPRRSATTGRQQRSGVTHGVAGHVQPFGATGSPGRSQIPCLTDNEDQRQPSGVTHAPGRSQIPGVTPSASAGVLKPATSVSAGSASAGSNTPAPSAWDSNLPLGEEVAPVKAADFFKYGQRMLARGKLTSALESFQRAAALEPDKVEYKAQLAWITFQRQASVVAQTEERLKEMLADAGDDKEARCRVHLILGRLARDRGDDEEELKQLQRALACNPASVEARREERLCHMRQNKEASRSWVERLFSKG